MDTWLSVTWNHIVPVSAFALIRLCVKSVKRIKRRIKRLKRVGVVDSRVGGGFLVPTGASRSYTDSAPSIFAARGQFPGAIVVVVVAVVVIISVIMWYRNRLWLMLNGVDVMRIVRVVSFWWSAIAALFLLSPAVVIAFITQRGARWNAVPE